MATETTTDAVTGGFAGDLAEAFTPPTAGSCCGSAPTAQASSETVAGCCGTDTAVAAGSCCGSEPVSEVTAEPAASGGCCE